MIKNLFSDAVHYVKNICFQRCQEHTPSFEIVGYRLWEKMIHDRPAATSHARQYLLLLCRSISGYLARLN